MKGFVKLRLSPREMKKGKYVSKTLELDPKTDIKGEKMKRRNKMIIKLESGKELTLEEIKEIVDKFQGLFGKKEYIPYRPVRPQFPQFPEPYYVYPNVTWK